MNNVVNSFSDTFHTCSRYKIAKLTKYNNVECNHYPKGKYKIEHGATWPPTNAKVGSGAAEE
jgi:hypothetical protein